MFGKILKCVLAKLHSKGHISSVYIDDFFLAGKTVEDCTLNVKDTLELLVSLGFDISKKSCLTPSNTLNHLGFTLDSIHMTVSLTKEKIKHITDIINNKMSRIIGKGIGFTCRYPSCRIPCS